MKVKIKAFVVLKLSCMTTILSVLKLILLVQRKGRQRTFHF